MGTNYYLHIEGTERPDCEACGTQFKEELFSAHVGKSSGGWRFLFQGYDPDPWYSGELGEYDLPHGLHTAEEWKRLMQAEGAMIYDEYDEEISYDRFWEMVENKQELKTHGGAHSNYTSTDGYDFCNRVFS